MIIFIIEKKNEKKKNSGSERLSSKNLPKNGSLIKKQFDRY